VNFEGRPSLDEGKWQILAALPLYAECNGAARERAVRHTEESDLFRAAAGVHELIGGGYFVAPPRRGAIRGMKHAAMGACWLALGLLILGAGMVLLVMLLRWLAPLPEGCTTWLRSIGGC
jgi:hypothetical protein